jgi:hypothetical protein
MLASDGSFRSFWAGPDRTSVGIGLFGAITRTLALRRSLWEFSEFLRIEGLDSLGRLQRQYVFFLRDRWVYIWPTSRLFSFGFQRVDAT